MLTNEKNENLVIFNTPQNFNISEAFPEFSQNQLPKIICLTNQINFFDDVRGYQVHIANHAWSYSLNNGQISMILDRLVQLKIIVQVGNFSKGGRSNSYRMVKPYTNENSIKHFFEVDKYLFLQKLKADNWIAVGAERSKFIKDEKGVSSSSTNYISSFNSDKIESLEAEVKILKEMVLNLSAQINSNNKPEIIYNNKIELSGTTIEDVLAKDAKQPEPAKTKVKKRPTIEDIIKADIVHQPKEIVQPEALNQVKTIIKIEKAQTKEPIIKQQSDVILITEQDQKNITINIGNEDFLFKNSVAFNKLDKVKQGLIIGNFRMYYNRKHIGEILIKLKNEDYNFNFDFEKKELTYISYSIKKQAA